MTQLLKNESENSFHYLNEIDTAFIHFPRSSARTVEVVSSHADIAFCVIGSRR
jgi:hypothetical protein